MLNTTYGTLIQMTSSNNILGEKLYEGRGGKLLEGKHTSIHRNGIAGEGLYILWPDIEQIFIGGEIDSYNSIPSGEFRSIMVADSNKHEISLEFIAVFRMKQENRNQFENVYAFILKNIAGTQWTKFMQTINSGGNYSFGNFYISRDGFYFSKVVSTWRVAKEAFDKIETRYIKKGIMSNGRFYIQYQDPNKKLKLRTEGVGEVRHIPNVHIVQAYINYINTTIVL